MESKDEPYLIPKGEPMEPKYEPYLIPKREPMEVDEPQIYTLEYLYSELARVSQLFRDAFSEKGVFLSESLEEIPDSGSSDFYTVSKLLKDAFTEKEKGVFLSESLEEVPDSGSSSLYSEFYRVSQMFKDAFSKKASLNKKPDSGSCSVPAVPGDGDEEAADSDSDDDVGPWYSERMDVRHIGNIFEIFFLKKIASALIQTAAPSYVITQHKRLKLTVDLPEYPLSNAWEKVVYILKEQGLSKVANAILGKKNFNAVQAVWAVLEGISNFRRRRRVPPPNAKDDGKDIFAALFIQVLRVIVDEMRQFIVHMYIETKKKKWIEHCGQHDVEELKVFSQSRKYSFYINVCGFYDKEGGKAGFGAIIRDFRGNPLACYSEHIADKEDQVSTFYHELQGVNAGLELASNLNLQYLMMFSTQEDIGFLVMNCQAYERKCRCDSKCLKPVERRCLRCVRRCVSFCQEAEMDDTEIEKIYLLLIEIMDKLFKLDRMSFSILETRSFNTGSVYYLAKLKGRKGKMELSDLKDHPKLRELLYTEASGELSNVFSVSLFQEVPPYQKKVANLEHFVFQEVPPYQKKVANLEHFVEGTSVLY